jgi:hypothetical protein
MNCERCVNFNLDDLLSKGGYQHHASPNDLAASAANGCEICNLVHKRYIQKMNPRMPGTYKCIQSPITCTLTSRGTQDFMWEGNPNDGFVGLFQVRLTPFTAYG